VAENAAPNLDELPIIPDENVADVDCCGCLIVRLRGDQAEIVCNECGAVVRRVAIGDICATMTDGFAMTLKLALTTISACGRFPGSAASR